MNNSQIIIYQTESGQTKIDVRLEKETVWLTQKTMAELFQTSVPNINMHLKNIFEEGELKPEATIKEFLIVRQEGNREVNRNIEYYNLDAIISVGYRIKSNVATRFRIWATQHIKEYIVKGFVMDDERLKNPDLPFDYFEELIRRIQDIRTSEKRFYQKITDIYATSVDYDPTQETSILFFKTVQNKMHWAITELSALNNLVEQYLVFAEGQAMRRIPMYMNDWIEKLHGFLSLNDREILKDTGRVSHELAVNFAETEYEKFRLKAIAEADNQLDDFEKSIKKIEQQAKKKKK